MFQLRLKISRSVFLAIGPRCFSTSLLTPSGPGAFFDLRFLMAEFSSEIFRVLFKHGLGTFSCFSSCLSFSFMFPTFFGVRGRVLSLLSSWTNSFAAFLSASNVLWTRRTVCCEMEPLHLTLVRLQSLLESFSRLEFVCLLVGCLTSQQHASVSQGRICEDDCMCCHTEIEVADQTFYLTQSQYTDTGPTSPSADPIMPGAWQGSHWSANF